MMEKCDLCASEEGLTEYTVVPKDDTITICSTCAASIDEPTSNENTGTAYMTLCGVQYLRFKLWHSDF